MVEAGILYGIVAFIMWGTADFFAKLAVDLHGTLKILFWQRIASAFLILIVFLVVQPTVLLSQNTILLIILVGALSLIAVALFMRGLEVGRLSIVAPVSALNPVITVLLALFFLNEFLTPLQAIAVSIIIAGSFFVSIEKDKKGIKKSDHGVFYGLGAAIMWGVGIFLFAVLIRLTGWLVAFAGTLLIMAVGAIAFALFRRTSLSISRKAAMYSILFSFFEVVGVASFAIGLERSFASLVAPVASAYPVAAVMWAAIFLHERLRPYQYASIAVLLIGLVLISL